MIKEDFINSKINKTIEVWFDSVNLINGFNAKGSATICLTEEMLNILKSIKNSSTLIGKQIEVVNAINNKISETMIHYGMRAEWNHINFKEVIG
jgi:hypothetical protein